MSLFLLWCLSLLFTGQAVGNQVPLVGSHTTDTGFEERCAAFATSLNIPDVTVKFTEFHAAGSNVSLPDMDMSCPRDTGMALWQMIFADTCRLALHVTTSPSSNITLEVWLPKSWTGRFLSGGTGGLSGCIQYIDLAYGTYLGFASVSSNVGHNGTSGAAFLRAEEVLRDYSYRGIHTGAVVGKMIAREMYGRDVQKAYFMGCSNGGRQGLQEAQMFPEDFDGIIAAAPAINLVSLISWGAWLSSIAGYDANSDDFIDPALWTFVQQEIVKQCDGHDGASDGIIETPELCNPVFLHLICGQNPTKDKACLTVGQETRLRQLYEPFYGLDGNLIFPRLQPGSEAQAIIGYLSGIASPFATEWFRYVVFSDPEYDARNINLTIVKEAIESNPLNVSAWSPDLSGFRAARGKLMMYHGTADGVIASGISDWYYTLVSETMGLSLAEESSFFRHFRVGGLWHCALGPGAWNLGMYPWGGNPAATPVEPEDNVLMAMVAWVEKGIEPEWIRGTKFVDDDLNKGIAFKRRHCRYPKVNVYVGPGSYTDEDAWECRI
ncbi:Tannase/feruloyl esterase [Xylariales sp. PMI_506]|nr:Tannase/feruloyl esterase [Xylariales sp. PMI_506]